MRRVDPQILAEHGAVSGQTGDGGRSKEVGWDNLWSVCHRIAGPGGGTAAKPVGLVYFGISYPRYEGVPAAVCRGQAAGKAWRTALAGTDILRRHLLGILEEDWRIEPAVVEVDYPTPRLSIAS